jgi:hypothetical protein
MNESAKNRAPPDRRVVGTVAVKSIAAQYQNGFVARNLPGARILDIGYRYHFPYSEASVPQAIGIDLQYPGYDGKTLSFADGSQDAMFASYRLAHVQNYLGAPRAGLKCD